MIFWPASSSKTSKISPCLHHLMSFVKELIMVVMGTADTIYLLEGKLALYPSITIIDSFLPVHAVRRYNLSNHPSLHYSMMVSKNPCLNSFSQCLLRNPSLYLKRRRYPSMSLPYKAQEQIVQKPDRKSVV